MIDSNRFDRYFSQLDRPAVQALKPCLWLFLRLGVAWIAILGRYSARPDAGNPLNVYPSVIGWVDGWMVGSDLG